MSAVISTNKFFVDALAKTMSADVSELGRLPFAYFDEKTQSRGFTLSNDATSTVSDWIISKEQRDPENDILFWELTPTADTIHYHPKTRGWIVIVYND